MSKPSNKSLLLAEDRMDKAERSLRKKLQEAYPKGTRVLVENGRNKVVIEITRHTHRLRELEGFNVKSGNTRTFSYLRIIEVVK